MINEQEKQFKASILEDIVIALKSRSMLLIKITY